MATRVRIPVRNRRIRVGLAFIGLVGFGPGAMTAAANAQGTQVGQMTCAQFATLRGTDRDLFLSWLYGYYSGAAQKPAIDSGLFQQASQSMSAICEKAPNTPMIGDQMRAVFLPGQQKPAETAPPANAAAPQQGSPGAPPIVSVPGGSQPFSGGGQTEGGQRIAIPQGIPDPQTTGSVRPTAEAETAPAATAPARSILDMLFGKAGQGQAPAKPRPE